MSKTNHTSYGAVATSECELTEAELDTKSTGASTRSNELRDADLTVVTGGNRPRGSLGGLGVIYFPSVLAR
jgi:hypothetical protein